MRTDFFDADYADFSDYRRLVPALAYIAISINNQVERLSSDDGIAPMKNQLKSAKSA